MIPRNYPEQIEAKFQALDHAATPAQYEKYLLDIQRLMLAMLQLMVNDYTKLQLRAAHKAQDRERLDREDVRASTDSRKQLYVGLVGSAATVATAIAVGVLKMPDSYNMAASQLLQTATGMAARPDQAAQTLYQGRKEESKMMMEAGYSATESCRQQANKLREMAGQVDQSHHESLRSIASN